MVRSILVIAGIFSSTLLAAAASAAATETYEYRAEHPKYGDIGSYINVVRHHDGDIYVDSELHIAVKLLGVVVYREEGRRAEHWRNEKLVAFDSETTTNGDKLEVHGEARGNSFIIRAPNGTVTAPAGVHPSNPWSTVVLQSKIMMSTRTGQVTTVDIKGGDERSVTLDGHIMRLHQYEIIGQKHQFVWFDDHGTPVAFRTEEQGANIDFVLVRRS
jgi:hypothetical protein